MDKPLEERDRGPEWSEDKLCGESSCETKTDESIDELSEPSGHQLRDEASLDSCPEMVIREQHSMAYPSMADDVLQPSQHSNVGCEMDEQNGECIQEGDIPSKSEINVGIRHESNNCEESVQNGLEVVEGSIVSDGRPEGEGTDGSSLDGAAVVHRHGDATSGDGDCVNEAQSEGCMGRAPSSNHGDSKVVTDDRLLVNASAGDAPMSPRDISEVRQASAAASHSVDIKVGIPTEEPSVSDSSLTLGSDHRQVREESSPTPPGEDMQQTLNSDSTCDCEWTDQPGDVRSTCTVDPSSDVTLSADSDEVVSLCDATGEDMDNRTGAVSPPTSGDVVHVEEVVVADASPDLAVDNCRQLEVKSMDDSDELLSALDAELSVIPTAMTTKDTSPDLDGDIGAVVKLEAPNGMHQIVALKDIPEFNVLKERLEAVQDEKRTMLENFHNLKEQVAAAERERDAFKDEVQSIRGKNTDEIYMAQIKALELTLSSQEKEFQVTRDKLTAHDTAAKRTIASMQSEYKAQLERVTKSYEECRREKEGMVMKYAQSEQKNLELGQKLSRFDYQLREMTRERDTVIGRFKTLKAEKQKVHENVDAKVAEVSALKREVEKQKEIASSHEVKTKWHQNKLKSELDAHKETKVRVEDLQRKLNEAKEETEMIRRDCQAMVKKYQECDEIKSVSLDKKLKIKETELILHKQEKSDQDEINSMIKHELDSLKARHKDAVEELKTLRDKVRCLEAERITQEHTLDRYKETLQGQKRDNKDLQERLARLERVDQDLQSATAKLARLEHETAELKQTCIDLQSDTDSSTKRESEHLDFTQKISDKNAHLQSENNILSQKVATLTDEHEKLTASHSDLQQLHQTLAAELIEVKRLRAEDVDALKKAVQDKSKALTELSKRVEEEKDEIRTLKRKHAANIKDLTRQLQQAKRRMENLDHARPPGDSVSTGSMGSRTSSNGSLDTLGGHNSTSRGTSQEPPVQEEAPPFVQVVEVDKQMLVEKIVRLQKAHARKNEKMEFMEDHISQLLEEVKKKSKVIQSYVLRDEAGTLASESMDQNKAQLVKKGGIMASLYSTHPQDGHMTIDLSLQINQKLQAVLEDTLLKNITLKENIETLGKEIARLSQENRRLQLNIQELCKS